MSLLGGLECCPAVSQQKGFYHCFGCGAHGTALGFLMEYERLEFPVAVEELARSVGVEVPLSVSAERRSLALRHSSPRRASDSTAAVPAGSALFASAIPAST